jgi:predicted permease
MGNILLLLFCFAAGIVLRRTGRLPDNASAALNGFIINIGLPALALSSLHKVTFDPALIYSALMPWVLFLIGAGLLWSICCRSPFPNGSTTC